MIFFMFQVLYVLSTLSRIYSDTVTSPQIRNVATKASETRLIPNRVEYRNAFHPYYRVRPNRYENTEPPKSYVIYEEYPLKIFKEWKANSPGEFSPSAPQNFLDLNKQPNAEFSPDYYFQNGPQVLPPPKPTLAYRSVYSNVIKVFDNSLDGLDRNRFQSQKYIKPFEGNIWKPHTPVEYEHYSQDIARRPLYHSPKLPENFPKVFAPNEKFHFPSFDDGIPQPPRFFYPQKGFYDTHTINYNNENTGHIDEVEILPEDFKRKNQKKAFLCGFIKVNQRQFPQSSKPCGRSDDLPIVPSEYPDYSNLPNDKIPVEHRRQHFQIKRIKRSELNQSYESRQKRNAGLGYGYSDWGSPLSYESAYEGYFNDNYPTRAGYRNSYSSGSFGNRNKYQNYRNRYSSGSRYDDYDDDYQSNEGSNSRGLTGYLTNGGRRYKNRKNNDEDEDDEDDNNDNNQDDDSSEEMERMNNNRRDTNDRRNNDESRDRRRNNSNNNHNNNNNNDDDYYRDNRRNNNNRNSNTRRNNNNRRNNDRSDNNNRNRYNSNGYSNNGYGSSYGGYGSNYGGNAGYGSSYGSNGGYGSGYGSNGGYGNGYGSNGGYGNGYGSNGGYGYGGYGNGFSSF